mgnify:FL=1
MAPLVSGRDDRAVDYRPWLLLLLGPLGFLLMAGWALVALVGGLIHGLRGDYDEDGPDEPGPAPRRRYRRREP